MHVRLEPGPPGTAEPPATASRRRMVDALALSVALTFIVWQATGPTASRGHLIFDAVIFMIAGVAVGVFQLRVAARVTSPRERIAWTLLGLSALVRITSGQLWTFWILQNGSTPRPIWMLAITTSALLLGAAGLAAFTTEPRRPVDRLRQVVDAGIVAVGSALVLWFVALGPFFEATGELTPRVEDYIYTIADSVSVLLAAVVFLRSDTRYMRTVAALMLTAHLVQVIPDVLFWSGKESFSYQPADTIEKLWFSVWALKGLAARYAEHTLAQRDRTAFVRETVYNSGPLPYVFLAAATVVLLLQLGSNERAHTLPSVLGAALLALLLVLREIVEIRERERLERRQRREAEWYGALLQEAYDVVVLLDAEGRAMHASPATERLAGDRAALQRPGALLTLGHPDDRPLLQAALDGRANAPRDLRYRLRANEQDEWHELALHVDDRRDDPFVGAVVVNGHDLTKQSRLSGRLRQSQELDALGVFAGGLAHDLNNILTVIDAHAELLQDDQSAPRAIREDLDSVRQAATRARRLTRGLLALSRRKSATDTVLDPATVVTERIGFAGLRDRVRVETTASALPVRVDPSAIALSIDALLLNFHDTAPAHATAVVSVGGEAFDAAAADVLQIAGGSYSTLTFSASEGRLVWHDWDANRPWETSPDDLTMLMALAAVREIGGTMVTDDSRRAVTMYIPSAVTS